MRKLPVVLLATILGMGAFADAYGAKKAKKSSTEPSTQPADDPAALEKAADGRATSLVSSLNIDDADKAARVHDIIAKQVLAIKQWHAANDDQVKAGKASPEVDAAKAQLKATHVDFIAKVSAELTPEQLERLKEKWTGGQMMATVVNYPKIVKNITDDDKAYILKTLQDGREDAMDSDDKQERIAIFKKYKGRINNYLNAHGHNVSQDYKDFGQAQKTRQDGATTQPVDAAQ